MAPCALGRKHRYVFTNAATRGAPFLNAIQVLDLATGTSTTRAFGPAAFAGEPIVVPRRAAGRDRRTRRLADEEDGGDEVDAYLLTHVYDSDAHSTDVVCLDARTLEEVFRIELGVPVPYSFHGAFVEGEERKK